MYKIKFLYVVMAVCLITFSSCNNDDVIEPDANMEYAFTIGLSTIGGSNNSSSTRIIDDVGAFTADYEEDEHIYYEFQKGINHLDGKQALAYVRERYGLREGDVARARHQQQVVKAVVDKLTTTTILTKYASLLGSMEGNFTTNIDIDSITAFAKMQLEQMPSWTIEMQVLEGSDAQRKTASIPNLYSAVMIPDEESVLTSVQKINELTE